MKFHQGIGSIVQNLLSNELFYIKYRFYDCQNQNFHRVINVINKINLSILSYTILHTIIIKTYYYFTTHFHIYFDNFF